MAREDASWRLDRRGFLRRTGGAGALLTVPGLVAACGSDDDSGGGGGGGGGDALKIGYVTTKTGALAGFGEADDFILGGVRQAFKGGIDTKDGKREVEILVKDSQS